MNDLQVTPERFFQACQGFHLSYALKAVGFDENELLDLPVTPQRVILSR